MNIVKVDEESRPQCKATTERKKKTLTAFYKTREQDTSEVLKRYLNNIKYV